MWNLLFYTISFLHISRAEPDLEFEGLLKRQHTRVKYFQGSLMNAIDLERAKVKMNLFEMNFDLQKQTRTKQISQI